MKQDLLVRVAVSAVRACEGGRLVSDEIRAREGASGTPDSAWLREPVWVAGAGKAVGAMARGAREALGARFRPGPLVGKHAEDVDAALQPHLHLAGHPLPDERGVRATEALLAFVSGLPATARLLLLLSGGASALLGAPLAGISLSAWREANRLLLAAGLPIGEMNVVRRHVGRALGGRLALATAARIDALALSDVVGDDPATIASGPVSPDTSTWADALAIADRAGITGEVRDALARGAAGLIPETPRPGDARLGLGLAPERISYRILATPRTLLARAAEHAAAAGLRPLVEQRLVEGDVEAVAADYTARFAALRPGEVLVAVGEPTVRLRGRGRGGRAQQLAGLVAVALAGEPMLFAAVGSDGTDGPTDAAGAAVHGGTVEEARAAGWDLAAALRENDASPPLASVDALVLTGATGTNLLDLHLLARLP